MPMHPLFETMRELHENATPGVWGPVTSPPKGSDQDPPSESQYVKDGERGEPSWGAVVSDADPRPGIDHERYSSGNDEWYWEKGTDIYGGTLVCESLMEGNGPFIAAAHTAVPHMINVIRNLRSMMCSVMQESMVDDIIAKTIEGDVNG